MTRRATSTRPPDWTRQPLVACIDGPLAHQWFTAADWTDRIENATYRAALGRRLSPELDYRPTGTIPHPHHPGVTGQALRHAPATEQENAA